MKSQEGTSHLAALLLTALPGRSFRPPDWRHRTLAAPSCPFASLLHGGKTPSDRTARRSLHMSNLVHNEQVKLAATFWNNLGVAALLGVFLVPAFYTQHTVLQQALSIGWGSRRRSACGCSPIGGSRG